MIYEENDIVEALAYFSDDTVTEIIRLIHAEDPDEHGRKILSEFLGFAACVKNLKKKEPDEKERSVVKMQSLSIAIAVMNYKYQDRRRRMSDEELMERISWAGLCASYERWNGELLASGFEASEVIEEELKRDRELPYHYCGKFKMFTLFDGNDEATFSLNARITPEGLVIEHYNRMLGSYLGYNEDDIEGDALRAHRIAYGKPRIKAFLDKNREFTGFYKRRVEICEDGVFIIRMKNEAETSVNCIIGSLTKLGVLVDREMRRRYPFEGIREYEKHSRNILKETVEAFKTYGEREALRRLGDIRRCVVEGRSYISYLNRIKDERTLRDTVIGCSYGATKDEVAERLYSVANIMFPDGIPERYISEIGAVEKMSPARYDRLKDSVFDI